MNDVSTYLTQSGLIVAASVYLVWILTQNWWAVSGIALGCLLIVFANAMALAYS